MENLLLNYEESLGRQLQDLICQLVKQQVKEQLEALQITAPPATTQPEQQKVHQASEADLNENQKPKKLCEQQLKKIIREMTPGLKRRDLSLSIQARMMMKLYENKEYGIAPSLLFSYAGTGKIAGYRYISFFKDRGYITFIGARQNGKYILTDKSIGLLVS